jgi:hypothetical protein
MTHQINRRKALSVVAIAFGGSAFATGEPGQLAALVSRYFAEVDAFNTYALTDGAKRTFENRNRPFCFSFLCRSIVQHECRYASSNSPAHHGCWWRGYQRHGCLCSRHSRAGLIDKRRGAVEHEI